MGYGIVGEFARPPLGDLRDRLVQAKTPWSGWSMWNPTLEPPYPIDGVIECSLAIPDRDREPAHSDFWRASPEGLFYLVRGYEDDGEPEKRRPGTELELVLPLWRVSEGLLHAARMARLLGAESAAVTFRMSWHGLRGRRMSTWAHPQRSLGDNYHCHQDSVTTEVTAIARDIPDRLVDLVRELTLPLYETFDFLRPGNSMFSEEVGDVIANERGTDGRRH